MLLLVFLSKLSFSRNLFLSKCIMKRGKLTYDENSFDDSLMLLLLLSFSSLFLPVWLTMIKCCYHGAVPLQAHSPLSSLQALPLPQEATPFLLCAIKFHHDCTELLQKFGSPVAQFNQCQPLFASIVWEEQGTRLARFLHLSSLPLHNWKLWALGILWWSNPSSIARHLPLSLPPTHDHI